MNCVIVDDDELSRSVLEDLINDTDGFSLVASCESGVDAFKILQEEPVDLLFLDIEMPKMDGMELIKNLNPLPQVVFITSHPEYAAESYEYDVTDFIQKPLTHGRFLKAINKAEQRFKVEKANISSEGESIFIKADSRLVRINLKDICYIEALGNYMKIYTQEGRFTILSTMKEIAEKLSGNDFVRVHRSYLVRLDKIESIEDHYIKMGAKHISIGKAYKEELTSRLNLL
ncbi:MAG: response regulator transcription factor [Crocinitomicaceae bacterium]|jgi:DNA-binding LytR/AlgR family response regulator|nr:response regulator transcription factor [Crocinitomicaceae bacterium]MBT6516098.1 response regulator transcription factor [Crocinitomicaceae bacterium]MDG2331857.1 LytTR family DNA-binding domain-containing protein [Flavobacteriales bacterium]